MESLRIIAWEANPEVETFDEPPTDITEETNPPPSEVVEESSETGGGLSDEAESEEAGSENTETNDSPAALLLRSPLKFIEVIESTDKLYEKVGYMNTALSHQMTDPSLYQEGPDRQ